MKVYIAGRYSRRDEFRKYANFLIEHGHEVTSRWLLENEPLNSNMGDHSDDFYIHTAKIDLEDVDRADAVLFFSEDPKIGTPRGGRHVEFGYALGKGKKILVFGPRENVFHYIDGVTHYNTIQDFVYGE